MIYTINTGGIYSWISDAEFLVSLSKMPDTFYKKFEWIDGRWMVLVSMDPFEGCYECKKNQIREPSEPFCNLIKSLF